MSATVGAALKKIAVALLSDTKILKKVAIFILSVLVGLLMPMAAVIGIFAGGNIEINEEDIENALTDEQKEYYAKLNARMVRSMSGCRKPASRIVLTRLRLFSSWG